ncbi:MAG: hypothetical protein AB8B92_00900 [Gammaproteobacteria bacterium]
MNKHFSLGVVITSTVTFFLLLFANACNASALTSSANEGLHRTVYESEALHSSSNFSKASHSRYYGKRNYRYKSKRNYYRGNRYYRGGNSYYRSNRYYHRGNRNYYPSHRYYGNRYNHRYRYGH